MDRPSTPDVLSVDLGDSPVERFVLIDRFATNLPTRAGHTRVEVEILVEPETSAYWAAVGEVGVAAAGTTAEAAAVAAMRAAIALL
jgi:hypothetical protein